MGDGDPTPGPALGVVRSYAQMYAGEENLVKDFFR